MAAARARKAGSWALMVRRREAWACRRLMRSAVAWGWRRQRRPCLRALTLPLGAPAPALFPPRIALIVGRTAGLCQEGWSGQGEAAVEGGHHGGAGRTRRAGLHGATRPAQGSGVSVGRAWGWRLRRRGGVVAAWGPPALARGLPEICVVSRLRRCQGREPPQRGRRHP